LSGPVWATNLAFGISLSSTVEGFGAKKKKEYKKALQVREMVSQSPSAFVSLRMREVEGGGERERVSEGERERGKEGTSLAYKKGGGKEKNW
jgi:hypothetical protein